MSPQPRRILIVEDNEQNLYLARFLLEREGHVVIAARNGREGIRLALAEKPDLIVMDIQMPELDGYETAVRLRESPDTQSIPLVAATSFAMVGDREKALAIGFTDYIEKPYEPETFIARIRRALERDGGVL